MLVGQAASQAGEGGLKATRAAVEVAVGRGDRGLPASRAEAQAAIPSSRPLLRNIREAGRALDRLRALLQKVWRSHDKSAALSPFLLTFQGGVRQGVPGAPVDTGLPAQGQCPLWREPGPARGSPGAVHVVHTHTRHGHEDPMNTRLQACEHTHMHPRGGHTRLQACEHTRTPGRTLRPLSRALLLAALLALTAPGPTTAGVNSPHTWPTWRLEPGSWGGQSGAHLGSV